MKKITLLLKCTLLAVVMMAGSVNVWGQISLTGTSHTQNFDGIGSGLPAGWTIVGGVAAYSATKTAWNGTSGGAFNYASANGLASNATATVQNNSTDRALGIRQIAGTDAATVNAGFRSAIASTTGLADFKLNFALQSLDASSPRVVTWIVRYSLNNGSSWTTATTTPSTLTTGGSAFTNTSVSVNFGNALNNISNGVLIEIVSSGASTGTGNRPTSAIDDFVLSWTIMPSCTILPTLDEDVIEMESVLMAAIDDEGDCAVTEYGFVYNTTGSPTIDDEYVEANDLDKFGNFTKDISELNLDCGTIYYFRSYAINGKGISYSDNDCEVETAACPCQIPAPTASAATSVTSTSFVANWSGSASNYSLNVYKDAPVNETESFDNVQYNTSNIITSASYLPGWDVSVKGTSRQVYSTAANSGQKIPSLCFSVSGDYVQTALYETPIVSLSFWVKEQPGTINTPITAETFIKGYNGTTWVDIEQLPTYVSTSSTYPGQIHTVNLAGHTDILQIKILFSKTGNQAGNLAIDDIHVVTGTSLPGYPKDVAGTSYKVTGLIPGTTYYYAVKAYGADDCSSVISPASNAEEVTTLNTLSVTTSSGSISNGASIPFYVNLVSSNQTAKKVFTVTYSSIVSHTLSGDPEFTVEEEGASSSAMLRASTESKFNVTFDPSGIVGSFDAVLTFKAAGAEDFIVALSGEANDPTGMNLVSLNAIKVYANNGNLMIESPEVARVDIFTVTGTLVATKAIKGSASFALPKGVYLIKAGNRTVKVVL